MSQQSPSTYFAPAGRDSETGVLGMRRFVEENPLFQAILDSIDGFLMILNPQRQVLAVNRSLLEALQIPQSECLAGGRPGEIIGCIHAAEGPDGCGTARVCATCGAVLAILASQEDDCVATGECLATVRRGKTTDALELRVRAAPVRIGPHRFTVLVLNDISGDKRRDALERTFFHDVLNTVGGLMGWSSLLGRLQDMDPRQAAERILLLSKRLKQEIEDQRRLSQAERGVLETAHEDLAVADILAQLASIFEQHEAAKGKRIEITPAGEGERLVTDGSLLLRVLTNMTKNALEATAQGGVVQVWFERDEREWPAFHVHNTEVIPEQVAMRIFQRSFSTKAASGRGIGTYSMKLFGERHLGGQVSFETSPGRGTIFSIKLPANAPAA